jgi:MoaA/NifB/PqqE/SkfB family radical SAM enzyme
MIATVPLRRLSAVWIQVTGTWCNLQCAHCLNASGPVDPWLVPMAADDVNRRVDEAARLGAREVYFTGGEPFLHPGILDLLAHALERLPATVLTNGTLITERVADRLAALAARSRYSLEVRVSLDDPDREANDRVRGPGAFDRALGAIARLQRRGLPAILTATDLGTSGSGLYDRLRRLLLEAGVARPRIKLLPLFPVGRRADGAPPPGAAEVEGFDLEGLQCVDSRTVTADGIYACPILAGLPEARLGERRLADALGPARLAHAACRVCVETGASCRNG